MFTRPRPLIALRGAQANVIVQKGELERQNVQHVIMSSRILYIENKSNGGHHGEAWIVRSQTSKSGSTVYFNNKALKKLTRTGIMGNHFDMETGEEYWITGVKKSGHDRHKFGGGVVKIEKSVVERYLEEVNIVRLDPSKFEIVQINPTDKSRFKDLENIADKNKAKRRQKNGL